MFNDEQSDMFARYPKCSVWKEREVQIHASIWTRGVEVKGICVNSEQIFKSRKSKPVKCGVSPILNKSLPWFEQRQQKGDLF